MLTTAVLLLAIDAPGVSPYLPWQGIQRAFQAVSAFDPFARDVYSVSIRSAGRKAVVRFDSISGLGAIGIRMDSGLARDRWKVGSVSFAPSLQPEFAKVNCTKALVGALPAMSRERWLSEKRFRISAKPTDNDQNVYVSIALPPYYEWNTRHFILTPSGKILNTIQGY